jgi:hypothetical protein
MLHPPGANGQLRTVISSEIRSSEADASLRLDFQDQSSFSIEFRDGQVFLDGEQVGSFHQRDALFSAWRSFIRDVTPLGDGPLAQALVDWAPPEGLADAWAGVADQLDQALEAALILPPSAEADPSPQVQIALPGEGSILSALLDRPEALAGLAKALEGISMTQTTVVVGEDMVVDAGEVVEGTLILVDGDLAVSGLVEGDVILSGGVLRILEGGRITGDLRISDGEVAQIDGSVGGRLVELGLAEATQQELAELEAELEELRAERRARASHEQRSRESSSNLAMRALDRIASAIGELLKNLLTFLVLCVLGVLVVHFQGNRMEVVATTARRAPTRSVVVGLAGGFLLFPVWVVGAVALAISIIGIPVLLVWLPLFPIAAGLAALLGYFAVARNVGEWVADQEYRGLEWIRGSNSFYTVVAGIGALMLPCVASNLVSALGIPLLAGALGFLGSMVTLAAAIVGLGAVLLTRGGRIRPHESYFDFEDQFWMEEEPIVAEAEEDAAEGVDGTADGGSAEEDVTEPAHEGEDGAATETGDDSADQGEGPPDIEEEERENG